MVRYADVSGVLRYTLGSTDILVTGPNSYSQLATLVSSVPSTGNPSSVDVTYSLAGPWNHLRNGDFTAALVAGQVTDTLGNTHSTNTTLGTFSVTVPVPDTTKPLATIAVVPDITAESSAVTTITVTYTDAVGVLTSTVGVGDLTVTGPGSYTATPTFVSKTPSTGNATSIVATYTLPARGGTWDNSDNGMYTITCAADAITDTSGNGNLAATRTFTVNVPSVAPSGFNYTSFNGATDIELNGSSAIVGNNLRVVPRGINETGGSAWHNKRLVNGVGTTWSTQFRFQFANPTDEPAHGLVFVMASDAVTSSSGNGIQAMGYGGWFAGYGHDPVAEPASCIQGDSLGIAFRPWYNPLGGGFNQVIVYANADIDPEVYRFYPSFDMSAATDVYFWVDYAGTTLSLYINDSPSKPALAQVTINRNLSTTLGTHTIFGFTGGTGEGTSGTLEVNMDVKSWSLTSNSTFIP